MPAQTSLDSHELSQIFSEARSLENLAHQIISHYKEKFPDLDFNVIRYNQIRNVFESFQNHSINQSIFEDENSGTWCMNLVDTEKHEKILFIFKPISEELKSVLINDFNIFQGIFFSIQKQISDKTLITQENCANLISQIAHDINSHISGLAIDQLNDTQSKKIKYLERMIPEVIFYVRQLELIKVKISANDLVRSVIDLHPQTQRFEILPDDANLFLLCDVELVSHACTAILDNAVRASENHIEKISIQVEKSEISSKFCDHSWVKIKITDRGPGIPEEFLSMVFNPFFTTYKIRGHVGLGLSVAKKIITAHGGTIDLYNNERSGVTVIITLPRLV